jgi:CRISPR-associated protein Csm3
MKTKLIKKIHQVYSIEIVTGIHIGDSKENVEIGGVDNPIIRRSVDNLPYLPGSSIKGKIRSLLEQIAGSAEIGGNSEINDLFGFANDNKPSKIIIRDSYMSVESKKALDESDYTDMPYSEVKFENTINRVTGKADNPRQTERVPAGTFFDLEIVINVWDNDADGKKSVTLLEKGIKALENDYLGGSGSRGYGQVKFHKITETPVSFEHYFDK